MASIGNDSGGKRRILFTAPDGKRKTIRLGKCPKRSAEQVKFRIEKLLESKRTGHALDSVTADWLAEVDDVLADRLARAGLAPSREKRDVATLGPFLDEYVSRRIDVKPATKTIWLQTVRNLKQHFGADRDMGSVNAGEAGDFRLFLIGQGLAPATIAKRLKTARMFYADALDREIVGKNPFAKVSETAVVDPKRRRVVPPEDIDRLMAVCPPTWQTIVALSRFAGMRCPSEVLSLKWGNVNWETDRMIVESPKTERYAGKDRREVPIFPDLKPYLEAAWDRAEPGAVYVVGGNYRIASKGDDGWRSCNLRTQFERLLKKAGLEPWPRLFHSMRGSRETELMQEFPIHVVTSWLGNSPQVALKHYLSVTDDDFAKAIERGTESGTRAAQIPAQHTHAENRTGSQSSPQPGEGNGVMRDDAKPCLSGQTHQVTPTGFEPVSPD